MAAQKGRHTAWVNCTEVMDVPTAALCSTKGIEREWPERQDRTRFLPETSMSGDTEKLGLSPVYALNRRTIVC